MPQLSIAQNSIAKRAISRHIDRIVEDDDAAMADQAVLRREGLIIEGRVEEALREIGAERAAALDGANRTAGERAAADVFDEFAEAHAKGVS